MGYKTQMTAFCLKHQGELSEATRTAICRPFTAQMEEEVNELITTLDYLDHSLHAAEYITYYSQYTDKIQRTREAIGVARDVLSKPLEYVSTFEDALQLGKAVKLLRDVDPMQDPEGAAIVFGKAVSSFGKLVQKLPPPASYYGEFLAGMETFFNDMRKKIDPNERYKHRRDWQEAMQ